MAELLPFIQPYTSKWHLEGRTFPFRRFLFELTMDGYFRVLHITRREILW